MRVRQVDLFLISLYVFSISARISVNLAIFLSLFFKSKSVLWMLIKHDIDSIQITLLRYNTLWLIKDVCI